MVLYFLGATSAAEKRIDGVKAGDSGLKPTGQDRREVELASVGFDETKRTPTPSSARSEGAAPKPPPHRRSHQARLFDPPRLAIPDVVALISDPDLNPCGAELSESELVRLEEILNTTRRMIQEPTSRASTCRSVWAKEKILVLGLGLDPGSPEAQEMIQSASSSDSIVMIQAINLDQGGVLERVVRIDPGEYPPLDAAYQDAWACIDHMDRSLVELFTSICP